MPRKNRLTPLVLVLALLFGLASEAAVALPFGSSTTNPRLPEWIGAAGELLSGLSAVILVVMALLWPRDRGRPGQGRRKKR